MQSHHAVIRLIFFLADCFASNWKLALSKPWICMRDFKGFYRGKDSSSALLGCDAVHRCGAIPTFRRKLLPILFRWRRTNTDIGPPKRWSDFAVSI